jgi:hypothetical protein
MDVVILQFFDVYEDLLPGQETDVLGGESRFAAESEVRVARARSASRR